MTAVSAANRATPDNGQLLPSREVGGDFCRSEGPIKYGDLVELPFQREHAVVAAAEEHLADVTPSNLAPPIRQSPLRSVH